MRTATLLLLFYLIALCLGEQKIPFLDLLSSPSVMQLAQMAAQLGQQTAQNAARNEREIASRQEAPEVKPVTLDQRPSEILGQTFTNLARPLKLQTLDTIQHPEQFFAPPKAVTPVTEAPVISSDVEQANAASAPGGGLFGSMFRAFGGDALVNSMQPSAARPASSQGEIPIRNGRAHGEPLFSVAEQPVSAITAEAVPSASAAAAPQAAPAAAANPLLQLAEAFLKGPSGSRSAPKAEGLPVRSNDQILPSMKQVVPGATENFGIPKGKGCLPFLGEFMQIAYGNCVKEADEAAYSSWTEELQSAVLSGKMDLLRASRESCRRGAEREQCNQLRQAISNCDIMDSLQITASLQRNLKRCEEISGIVDQNPITMMNQIGQLVNGEFAHGFLNNFLG